MNIHKIGLVVLFFCFSISTAAQKYYEKNLNLGFLYQQGNGIVNTDDGNFFLTGSYYTNNPLNPFNPWQFLMAKVTPQGDTLWVKKFPLNEGRYYCGAVMKTEYGFMLPLSILNQGHRYIVMMQLDTNGNVLRMQNVGTLDYDNIALRIVRTEDKGYLVAGKATPTNTVYYPYALRVDSNLQVLWERYYPGYNTDPQVSYLVDATVADIVPEANANYLWGLNYDGGFTGAILLLQINDSNGELLMDTLYRPSGWIDTQNDYVHRAKRTTDGGFIASGEQNLKGVFMKFDANLNLVWTSVNIFRETTAVELFELADGGFVGGGSVEREDGNDWNIRIAKVNANGLLQWQRTYGSNLHDYAYGMTNTPNGGYLITGRSYLNDTVSLYLLKTNCMGLLTEPQANFTTQIDTAALLVTLQNASQYTYPDSLDGGHYLWDFGDGTPPLQTQNTTDTLLHTYPQYGTYTVTLKAIVCTDTSTLQQTLTVGYPPPPPTIEGIVVSPNPATNQLFINSQEPLQANLVLYNALGQKVGTTALSGNSTQINVANLPSGIYLYQIINPQNQTLQYGKVSILQ
jgi:PKD repeat protein